MILQRKLTRRDLLITGAGITASLFLPGCGGLGAPGGSGGSGVGVTGFLVLPTGSSLKASDLTVKVSGLSQIVGASGSFSITVSNTAPCLAMATDANGNGILAGYLDSTLGSSQTIDSHSTAVALVFLAIGGQLLPSASKSAVLALVSANSAIPPLAAVIDLRVAANPLAVSSSDSQIVSALATAVAAISPPHIPGLSVGQSGDQTRRHAPATSANVITLTVSPTTVQSGMSVRPDGNITGLDVSNSSLRSCSLYIYEVETQTGTTINTISPARLIAGPVAVGNPGSTVLSGGLDAILSNPAPLRSFTLTPIPLGQDGSSDRTSYEVVVIGPGNSGVSPSFLTAPRYANELNGWLSQLNNLYAQSFYVDLLYTTVLEIGGYTRFSNDIAKAQRLTVDAIATSGVSFTQPSAGSPSVNSSQMLSDLNSGLGAVTALRAEAARQQTLLDECADDYSASRISSQNPSTFLAQLHAAYTFFVGVISQATGSTGLFSPFSHSPVIHDLANADPAVLFGVEVKTPNVTITPKTAQIVAGSSGRFTVALSPSATGSSYEYDWSTTSNLSKLSAVGETNIGPIITTAKKQVDLITDTNDDASIIVNVIAYDTTGGHRVEYGRTSAAVTVTGQMIAPIAYQIFVYETSHTNPDTGIHDFYATAMAVFKPTSASSIYRIEDSNQGTLALITTSNLAESKPVVVDGSYLSVDNCYGEPGGDVPGNPPVYLGHFYNVGSGKVAYRAFERFAQGFASPSQGQLSYAEARAQAVQYCQTYINSKPLVLKLS